MSAQNMYDDPTFFEKYSAFPRVIQGARGASEWPELQKMLPPDFHNMKALDLTCGEGWFGRWCIEKGAVEVDACDISVNMLAKAEMRTHTSMLEADKTHQPGSTVEPSTGDSKDWGASGKEDLLSYFRIDMEKLNVIQQVHASLVTGGIFVFYIEYPFLTVPKNPNGLTKSEDGEMDQWQVDSYFEEGERSITWLVKDIIKQHRTLSSYFSLLTGAGFEISKMDEWDATEQKARKHPDWVEGVIPRFLLVAAKKRG